MELQDAINRRHSVRQFTDQPVGKQTITKIVELAQRAPSWVNSQPWQVYCATGKALQAIKDAPIVNRTPPVITGTPIWQ